MKSSLLVMAFLVWAGSTTAAAYQLDDAYQNLKQAEDQKDAAQVKKLAAEVHALAVKAIAEPAPQNADDKEAWTARVAYAKDIDLRTEYALYAVAASQGTPAATVDLISALEQQNPKSQYLEQAYGAYLGALEQTGAKAKIPAIAAKALENFPENEDLLYVVTEDALAKQQNDRACTYAMRLTSALLKHPKPEGIAAADWERRRNAMLGRSYWIAGVIHGSKNEYAASNKELRAALPLIKGNDAMMQPALFYLGLVNHQLGLMTLNKAQVLEGQQFSKQAAAIQGPLAQQAWRNAAASEKAASTMR